MEEETPVRKEGEVRLAAEAESKRMAEEEEGGESGPMDAPKDAPKDAQHQRLLERLKEKHAAEANKTAGGTDIEEVVREKVKAKLAEAEALAKDRLLAQGQPEPQPLTQVPLPISTNKEDVFNLQDFLADVDMSDNEDGEAADANAQSYEDDFDLEQSADA